ncbi:MAG: hypothetical protein H0X37_16565 [Herpetosiphonaceae bacterium]|nr:hypothetical protein [Herpetosiphonaceae bacterium]
MNGATLVALGYLRWRALRPVIGLVLRGVPVITTLAAPSARRAAAELRQWWTRPYPPLRRRTMRHPRASLPPIPMRVVAVTVDGTIGAIMQLGGQAYRPAER